MAFSGGNARSPFTISQGQAAPAQAPGTASTANFSFGGGLGIGGSSGFNFGGQSTAAPSVSAPQLSFTASTPVSSAAPPLFNFGNPAANTAPAPISGTPAQVPNFQFGPGSGPAPTTGQASVPSVPTMDKGFAAANFQSAFGPGSVGVVPANVSITSLPSAPVSFSTAPPSTVASSVQPTFVAPITSQATVAPGTTLGAPTAVSSVPQGGFSFGTGTGGGSLNLTNVVKPNTTATVQAPAIPPQTTQGTVVPPPTTQAPTTTSTAAQPTTTNVSQINFRQLQETINKWMLDLQEEEKVFVEQATKVNAWDRTLIANGDKIAKLNDSISKVKTDHGRLEHALEYIKTQQQEFESFLEPLEAGLPLNIPVEPEREQLYTLTDSVDTQLQQMSEDLKEVIRHINEANKTVDKNDPVSQILRILNEHMDALHWVEDNTNQIKRSMEDVSKQHQTAKKEHERSLRMMFK